MNKTWKIITAWGRTIVTMWVPPPGSDSHSLCPSLSFPIERVPRVLKSSSPSSRDPDILQKLGNQRSWALSSHRRFLSGVRGSQCGSNKLFKNITALIESTNSCHKNCFCHDGGSLGTLWWQEQLDFSCMGNLLNFFSSFCFAIEHHCFLSVV